MKWDLLADCNKIVYFDLVDDTLKILPSPTRINPEKEDSIEGTGIIEGCFCMARTDEQRKLIHVSIVKEYGKQESWVTYFAISLSEFGQCMLYNLDLFSHNGKVLMKGTYIWSTYVYDIKEERLEQTKFVVQDGVECDRIESISFYVESLGFPREMGWRDGDEQKCMMAEEIGSAHDEET
ncbi:unnamed protein product [Cuscuta epithymum]|uniref:F-box associated domain-containing protein n=1 Tax=Cuscuta epithymum TaxID=186058 RepID=A0AAV0GAF7_9ASTE|nr:unnamed protein product [Cuscuta epithymum]